MLLHRCSLCGREYLPNGVHATWHKNIGRIPKHILNGFCHCNPPRVERSESLMEIDYNVLNQCIIDVGKEMNNNE